MRLPQAEASVLIGRTFFNRPFHPSPQFAVLGDLLYWSTGERHEIEVRSIDDGSLLRVIRTEAPPRRVTAQMIAASESASSAPPKGPALAQERRSTAAPALPYPDVLPAIGLFRTDTLGHLWVRRYALPWDAEYEWWIFDRHGRFMARTSWPSHFRVTEIGLDYVLGIWRDEDDVETVRMFTLERRSTGESPLDR